ncbi:3-oxoacyl-[acyl-carrier-protein] synthase [Ceratobasidium sp. 395]|nr:3-oxoacyl-[acyl-carrier-protein] synthase [Ceratobasidium sp. 395]
MVVSPHSSRTTNNIFVICGSDLAAPTCESSPHLSPARFAEQVFSDPAAFPDTATHAIEFGPGGMSDIGSLTVRDLDGRGVRVVIVGDKGKSGAEVYDATNTSDGKIQLDTTFSRLLGKPPIMVAGMTPATVETGFVSAVLRAGYHVELAGGEHYNAGAPAPRSPKSWRKSQQASASHSTRSTSTSASLDSSSCCGKRCVARGCRSKDSASLPASRAQKIDALRAAGIRHLSFNRWAAARADTTRARTSTSLYSKPMELFGNNPTSRSWPGPGSVVQTMCGRMSEEWSVQMFGAQPMPFDGVLFASRVMVAKEAHTSKSVKDFIVAAAGVDDAKWDRTYAKETGGILTVQSELGEPIHKVATGGVKLWKEFDDTVFKLPKKKRAAWLAQNKHTVIEKLNKDFAKPWFAQKANGTVVGDIADMTYEEVVRRMVRLMYVAHETRWVDRSLRNLVGDWLCRVEERFADGDVKRPTSILQSFIELDEPTRFSDKFFKAYPLASKQLFAAEDKAYFLAIAQRPGQKPVPFVPVLDASFEVWFKKDSLWAAEDIEAVFDQDPQRVCILQGPVAVKHAKVADEPIKDMLGNVESGLVARFLKNFYGRDKSKVPTVDYIGAPPAVEPVGIVELHAIQIEDNGSGATLTLGDSLPPVSAWMELLAGPEGGSYVDNPLKRIFAPRRRQVASIKIDGDRAMDITMAGGARSHGIHDPNFKAVELTYDASSSRISLTIFEERTGSSIPLSLAFDYKPSMGYAPTHEVSESRNWRIKEFYWKPRLGDNETLPEIDNRDTFVEPEVTITAEAVERFCAVMGNQGEEFKSICNRRVKAQMDFALNLFEVRCPAVPKCRYDNYISLSSV